ncbi:MULTISPECIES: glycosyltransferase family 4 protein [Luteimonas]|uniref:glycosyltransferase family 4 protein n=1 Tax=Luteimonas TaxID=83614 RepID=UPI000C7A7B94|nr:MULTISPECIES: glycosyltransferase family 4 protein [Luteimonas]
MSDRQIPVDAVQLETQPVDRPAVLAMEPTEVDQDRWPRLLWARDRARGARSVLLIGGGVSPLAVLLAREGARVTMLDAKGEALEELAEELEAEGRVAGSDHILRRLSSEALREVLSTEPYDAIVVLDGYWFELPSLLPLLTSSVAGQGAVIISVAFDGRDTRDGAPVFPSTLLETLPAFAAEQMDFVNGQVEAVFRHAGVDPVRNPGDALALTERIACHEMQRLSTEARAAVRELQDTRESLAESEQKASELRESTAFRLGLALVLAARSPREFFKLPLTVMRLFRGRRTVARSLPVNQKRTGFSDWDKESIRNLARQVMEGGSNAVMQAVRNHLVDASDSTLSFGYLIAAQACGSEGRHDLEFEIASHAIALNRSVGMLRGFLHVALRCRRMVEASETLRELHSSARSGNRIAKDFIKQFKNTSSYKIAVLESIPPRPTEWAAADGDRFVYVLHNSLPYSSGGYATRSHGVAAGLHERGHNIVCLTRPGFPLDIRKDLAPVDAPIVDVIDAIPYQRIRLPSREGIPEYRYVLSSAKQMEEELRRLKPAYVQAASNYVTGLPALIAARRIGVPFFYEVRGLWEITRMSRDQQFGESISFDVQRHIEGTLAKEADHVFTLTEPMREELIERGVDPERITLLPNSVDADRFQPVPKDLALSQALGLPDGVPVIGYIGTFVIYEGLEHLAEACVMLHARGHDFRLLLVGNENASGQERGPITEEVLRIAREGGIEDKLIMPGRIPHEQVESYYSMVDICPFPRKPWPVCEMVSPMKPLEALAMEKAVVVSSVRALVEMIEDGVTGRVFEKGNVESLADVMEELILDPGKRSAYGRAGRDWVVRERSWNQIADKIEGVIAQHEAVRANASTAEAVTSSSTTAL